MDDLNSRSWVSATTRGVAWLALAVSAWGHWHLPLWSLLIFGGAGFAAHCSLVYEVTTRLRGRGSLVLGMIRSQSTLEERNPEVTIETAAVLYEAFLAQEDLSRARQIANWATAFKHDHNTYMTFMQAALRVGLESAAKRLRVEAREVLTVDEKAKLDQSISESSAPAVGRPAPAVGRRTIEWERGPGVASVSLAVGRLATMVSSN